MSIFPIPTEYRGIKFRSRLEARWAIFMDSADVKYDYEPEAYNLGDGVCYLPDFWLPGQQCYYEIKPGCPNLDEQHKASLLARQTGHNVFVEFISPQLQEFGDHGTNVSALLFMPHEFDTNYWWCECPKCGNIELHYCGYTDRFKCHANERDYGHATPKLRAAYETARGHQFWNPKGVA